jgi:hypothetical protein
VTRKPTLAVWILTIILAGASMLYLASLTPNSFGYYHDDGIYVATAKALATGQGYRIISLPYEPAQTKYPPFYPFVLSLIWGADPRFPENLFPMMLLSVITTLAFLTLTWLYLTRKNYAAEWEALLIVGLTALNWRTIILATNIYSEMLYSVLSVGALLIAEGHQKKLDSWVKNLVLGILLGVAFLTRTSAISLIIALISLYFFRRQFQKASLMLAIGGTFVVAWTIWCSMNLGRIEGISAPYYTSYLGDFVKRIDGLETLLRVIGLNAFMLLLTSIPLVSLGIDYAQIQNFAGGTIIVSLSFFSLIFLLIVGGFFSHITIRFHLLHVYVLSYLGLHLFWPYTSYDRFLAPILPFLLLFLITAVKSMARLVGNELSSTTKGKVGRKLCAGFIGLLLLAAVSVGLCHYALGIHQSVASKDIFASRAAEDRQAIQWINANTEPSSGLLCYRDPQYYLYTSRKAVRSFAPQSSAQAQLDEPKKIIFGIIKESGSQYLVLTSSDFEQENQPDLIRKTYETLVKNFPQTFIPQFQSADGRTAIYYIQRRGSKPIGLS